VAKENPPYRRVLSLKLGGRMMQFDVGFFETFT
jgi:hypothetical protein